MIDLIRSRDIAAPAAAVGVVLADDRRDATWRTGVVAMEPDTAGPARPFTTTRETLRLSGRTYVDDGLVEAVDPGRRLTWRTTAGADANGFRLVEPLDDGRGRVTLALTARPHGPRG